MEVKRFEHNVDISYIISKILGSEAFEHRQNEFKFDSIVDDKFIVNSEHTQEELYFFDNFCEDWIEMRTDSTHKPGYQFSYFEKGIEKYCGIPDIQAYFIQHKDDRKFKFICFFLNKKCIAWYQYNEVDNDYRNYK